MTAGYIESTGSLSNGAVLVPAKADRRGIIIGNPSDALMYYRVGGATASATAGVPVPIGNSVSLIGENAPSGAVSLFCAGSSKAYCIYEW